ncbi:MAG: cytochrome c oxidase subunit 2 [Alphaproteobacteria bacterium]|nr:cytochrome c oxidase subunit 2 [Alphaproteobacteria bacterium]
MKLLNPLFTLPFLCIAAACSRNPSVLQDPAGPHAEITGKLFRYFFAVNGVIFLLVLGFLFFALWRRRERQLVAPLQPDAQGEKRLLTGVVIAVSLTIIVLTSFVILSYAVDKNLIGLDKNPALEIEITGHQWWWEVRYLSKTPSDVFTTANEIHVPLNTKIRLILKSSDVIHSVWFPNLAGKRDIIPGHDQDLFIRVDKEGTWQGRCGEFCGMQHAFMGLTLFAEPKPAFEAWEKAQRLPAEEPQSAEEKHGKEVFTTGACAMCHVIRGTDSTGYSSNAPDLTHLKSRATIGAGAAANTKGDLGGWILDPHGIKPGVHMPTISQEPQDFQALLSYLETLK